MSEIIDGHSVQYFSLKQLRAKGFSPQVEHPDEDEATQSKPQPKGFEGFNGFDKLNPAPQAEIEAEGMSLRAKRSNHERSEAITSLRSPTVEPEKISLAEDAERQLNEAEKQAAAILEEAKKKAERIKDEALKKGYQEGLKKGEEAGKRKVFQESDSLFSFFQNAIDEVSSLKSSILRDMEPEIVKLSLMLAEKLVLNSYKIHPEAIASMISILIKKVDDEEGIKILVNPSLLPILEEYQHQFLEIKSKSKLEILGDEKISEGGCLIVTDTKILDAQIETRFMEAAKTLLG